MHDLNWWLMALAFILGLLLTFAVMIRRVRGEVPVTTGATARLSAPAPVVTREEHVSTGTIAAAGATAVGGAAAAKYAGEKFVRHHEEPTGYSVKGYEDTMIYYTRENPRYKETDTADVVWFANEESARRAGFSRWDESGGAVKFADVPAGPYGSGSAKAGAGGTGPAGWTIKGNEDSMLYHTIDSPTYKVTIAEVWFADEEAARRAGFSRWDKNIKK